MSRFRALAVFALAAGFFIVVGTSTAQLPRAGQAKVVPFPGKQKVVPRPVQPFPAPGAGAEELPLLPKSSHAFVSIKVSELVDHPEFKPVIEQFGKTPEAIDGVYQALGVGPQEIDRITLFSPNLDGDRWIEQPVLVMTTRAAYNEARVLKSLRAEPVFNENRRGKSEPGHNDGPPTATKVADPPPEARVPAKDGAKKNPPPPEDGDACTPNAAAPAAPLYYEIRGGKPFQILFLVDDRTLVFLAEDHGRGDSRLALIAQLLKRNANGPLAEAIAAASKHTFAAGINLAPVTREFDGKVPPELAPYAALMAARTAIVTGDIAKGVKLSLTLSFDDAAAAKRATPVLAEGLKTVATLAAGQAAVMKAANRPEEQPTGVLFEMVAAALKNATVSTVGATVVAAAEIEFSPAAGKAVGTLFQTFFSRKKFLERANNLKQIGLALHNYESVMQRLPTNVTNAKGEVLLSWRVLLLPYLEQDNLYKRFKLDEPWDSPNNKPLIEMMPKIFAVSGREAPKGKTFFQAFLSPNPKNPQPKGVPFGRTWLIDGDKQGRTFAAITDGTSNTIAVAEARDAVIWSKPDDIPFGAKLPPLGEEGASEFMVLMLDGSARSLPTKIDPVTLRAMITADGGEVVDIPRDRGATDGLFTPVNPKSGSGSATPPPGTAKSGGSGAVKDKYEEKRRQYEALEKRFQLELERLKVEEEKFKKRFGKK